jgi:hypothetical protein
LWAINSASSASATILERPDLCLAGNADVAIERQDGFRTCGLPGGAKRERFERELRRATHLASFAVVISGTLEDLIEQRRGLNVIAGVGTLAAWSRLYRHSFVFAGSDAMAADFTFRSLSSRPERRNGYWMG